MTETSRVVAVIDKPIPVTDLTKITKGLEAIYGKGLTIGQGRWARFEVRTPGPVCWCHTCEDRDAATVDSLTGDPMRTISRFMILCPDCGNKRCPKANHHDYDCTGSNETGQEGSAYAEDPIARYVRLHAWWSGHRDVCTDCNCPDDRNPHHATTTPRETDEMPEEGER